MARSAEVEEPEVPVPLVRDVWTEERRIRGGLATVQSFVVPKTGVGWVDFHWRTPRPTETTSKRLLADWSGVPRAALIRQVVGLADDWFKHCAELAEREAAFLALRKQAAEQEQAKRPGKAAGQRLRAGSLRSALGSAGPHLMGDLPSWEVEDLLGFDPEQTLSPFGSAAPEVGGDPVQGRFSSFARRAVRGATEDAGDGLGDLGDGVTKPEVGR
jgi:hypothetical protein